MRLGLSVSSAALIACGYFSIASVQADVNIDRASDAAKVLMQWYDWNSGIWHSTGWWNQANCLQALADLQGTCPECHLTGRSIFEKVERRVC